MGRRCRHLRLKSAGAHLVFDARYLSGADSSTVGTWPDRSGGGRDATQGTEASKPLLRTGANGRASQSVVKFDGSNDRMTGSVGYGAGEASIFVVGINNSANLDPFNIAVSLGLYDASPYTDTLAHYMDGGTGFRSTLYTSSNSTNYYQSDDSKGSWHVFSCVASTSASVGCNLVNEVGTVGSTGTMGGGTDSFQLSYWASGNQYHDWALGIVAMLPYAAQPPLRKRISHHLAFSYKKSCS